MSNSVQLKEQTPGWLSEPKHIATLVVGILFLAVLGYLFLTFVLPWLVTVTWNLVNLIIGGVVLGFLLLLVMNNKFWRAIRYFAEFIANYTIGLAIELNPFNILEAKIAQGYKDRQILFQQGGKLKGKHAELSDKVKEKEKELQMNAQKVKILQAQSPGTRQIELYANNVVRNKEYIDNVTPIITDLEKLVKFTDQAYEDSGIMLEDAKMDLESKKDLYYSVTTGLSAVSAAMKAFKGDDDLNRDAEKALAVLKVKIGEKIGNIKSAINVTSRFMDDQALEDKAKSSQAIELINQFNTKKNFNYSDSLRTGTQAQGNLKDVYMGDRYKNLLD